MNTPYSNIYNRFIILVSKDKDLLNPRDKDKSVFEKKLKYLLDDAISDIMLRGRHNSPVNLTDKDDSLNCFNFELTLIEEQIIARVMLEKYVDETTLTLVGNMKNMLHYTDEQIKVFCPSNSLTAFQSKYSEMVSDNDKMIDSYKTRDRETYKKNAYLFQNENCLAHDDYNYSSRINGQGSGS